MSDVAYITNAAATLTFTAGSKTVTVTGTNPILEGVLRGDRAPDPNGMELAIDVVAAGTLTLLRNAPTSGTVQFDIAPVSRLRTSLAANAEVTREVYAKLLAATEDNRSIPVISLATSPPGSPADGDRHLVIATATGAFVGKEGYIAQYDSANVRWIFIAPIAGMKVTVDGSAVIRVYTGAAWTVTGATTAADVAFTPTGGVAATTVQTAIAEVDSEKVSGPASATDNAIARFDGTTGKAIQNSGATIDDSGNLTAGPTLQARRGSAGDVMLSLFQAGVRDWQFINRATVGTLAINNGSADFVTIDPLTGLTAFNGAVSIKTGWALSNQTTFAYDQGFGSVVTRIADFNTHTWRLISGAQLATLNATGLMLGTGTPSYRLDVLHTANSQTGARIKNADNGATAGASFFLEGAIANSSLQFNLWANSGAPFAQIAAASAVTGLYVDAALHVWRSAAQAEWARLTASGLGVGGSPNLSGSGVAATINSAAAGTYAAVEVASAGVLRGGFYGNSSDVRFFASGSLPLYLVQNGGVQFWIGSGLITANLPMTTAAMAHRQSALTLVNGANQNVAKPAFSSLLVAGPSAAFNIGGLTGGTDGLECELVNTTAHQMTLNNEDASSTAGNRIATDTGGNLNCKHAVLRYDATASRWRVISFRT